MPRQSAPVEIRGVTNPVESTLGLMYNLGGPESIVLGLIVSTRFGRATCIGTRTCVQFQYRVRRTAVHACTILRVFVFS